MSKKKHRKLTGNNTATGEVESNQKTEKVLTKASGLKSMTNWLILLLIFIPVLFSKQTMDPNITIRYLFMCGVLISMVVYFYVIRKTPFKHPQSLLVKSVFVLGLAFAAWSVVSMFSAINYREGYYEVSRHLLNIILLFLVMTAVSKEGSQMLKLCKVLVFVSLVQSFVGILQFYDIAFQELPGANAKPFGLMSNRNLFGSAQAFMLPFVIYVLYKAGRFWKYLSAFAIISIVISLLLSQTRSAWLAAIAILVVSFILVLIFSPVNRKKWIIGTVAAILCIAGIVFIVLTTDHEGSLKESVTQRSMTFSEAKDTLTESVANVQERFKIWNKTLNIIKDKPLTGAGPGNWKINITAYGTEGLIWAYGKYAPDRPHNIYLLLASETGIPGAILYVGMWILIAVIAFKVIYKPQSEDQRILNILMLAGIAAFACDGMFSFPTERIEHSLYVLLMGGIILGSFASAEDSGETTDNKPVSKPLLLLFMGILSFNFFIGYKKYNYEVHLNRAKAYEDLGNFSKMLEEAEAGKSDFITMGPETGIILELKTSIALKELKEYDKAMREINIAKTYNPYSANTWSTMGTIYTDLKQYDKAVPCYEKALSFTPHHDIVLKNLSVNYFMVNNYKACINTLKKLDIKGDAYLTGLFDEATRRMNELK